MLIPYDRTLLPYIFVDGPESSSSFSLADDDALFWRQIPEPGVKRSAGKFGSVSSLRDGDGLTGQGAFLLDLSSHPA
jgi:hypothetical protein